ncbi:RagB/SusD family nutrient uptake outer membrane protein [uncultured Prevotella sp.]|uniref:RagB/SusD family nutrient uptake outer membrane protein n=1 Tax=uncultured Prevotella sp. TaxID=159272 RepID=UPI0025CD7C21|nr:RagB/SusD family nutrient uptake outer membrane protein [uncultured Prevotella sp.]
MKKIYYLMATALIAGATSCTNLHEEILDEQNGQQLVSNPDNLMSVIAPAYINVREIFFKNFELTTDELCIPARGSDWKSSNTQPLVLHDFKSTNTNIRYIWRNTTAGISACNTALLIMADLEQTPAVTQCRAEMLFIRALLMFTLNDAFGQVPYREYTETDFSKYPQLLNRKEACEVIERDLLSIIPTMKQKGEVEYGHATKAAAQTLLAKLYLNWQVFTGTSPEFTDGTQRWSEVIALCNDIINSGKYKLADDWWELFSADNAKYGDQTETIFPLINDIKAGVSGDSWMSNVLHYNQTFGPYTRLNNGFCTTPEFLATWDPTDPRYSDDRMKAQTGFNLGFLEGVQYDVNGNELKTRKGETLNYTRDFPLYDCPENGGVRVVKYAPNMNATSSSSSDNDVQYYRLTDIYLMRAEAKMRSGDKTGALEDLNTIRRTRGVKEVSAAEFTLDKIYNERGYEFYWEVGENRRMDMIRFGHFFEARTTKPNVTESYKYVFPIPEEALQGNPNLKQNAGYK